MSKITILTIYMLLILTTSLIPMDRSVEGLNFIIDINPTMQNILHVPAFAILSILWLQVLKQQRNAGKGILFVLLMSAGFGILNELIQLSIPGRYPSVIDICFNTIGALCGVLLYLIFERNAVLSSQRHRAR